MTRARARQAPAAEKDGDEKVSKMQARMLRRQARAKQWAEFNATKPDEKYEDPVDVANIHYAESHMGDFSLKTDEDYVVPETQRVNAQKKRRQIVLLDESIHAIKMGFNERFLALRDLKRRLIDSMKAEDTRLHEIALRSSESRPPSHRASPRPTAYSRTSNPSCAASPPPRSALRLRRRRRRRRRRPRAAWAEA